ncbi:MAG: hypothetical protein WCA36_06965 [Pseudolabrys sp.]
MAAPAGYNRLFPDEREAVLTLIKSTRENLERLEAILTPVDDQTEDELDVSSPLNKDGVNLTARGVEVCYRLFDAGKTRYAVAQAMSISYGAATHRFHAWEKLGGINREKKALCI